MMRKKRKSFVRLGKKGQGVFDSLMGLGVGLAGFTILITVAFLVMAQAKSQIVSVEGINESNSSTWTVAYNGTNELISATADVPPWLPLIVIVSIGGILISLIAAFRVRVR